MPKIVIALISLIFLTGCSSSNKVLINGSSMEPTLNAGEMVIYKKVTSIARYDIIVFKYEDDILIKRVYALPGETIECRDGNLFINNEIVKESYGKGTISDFSQVSLKENEYFVLGDNHDISIDSIIFGPINSRTIMGVIR